MKQLLVCAVAAVAAAAALPAAAGPNVGVSVSINQPGVYGRIDIGNVPPPLVLYPQPVVIVPSPVAVYQQPIYMHVPPGHAQNWGRFCGRYNACGQPVYFVQEGWYSEHYGRRHDRDDGDDHDDDHGRGRKNRHGEGEGRGHGHGHDD